MCLAALGKPVWMIKLHKAAIRGFDLFRACVFCYAQRFVMRHGLLPSSPCLNRAFSAVALFECIGYRCGV